jgi:hypothetical protein
VALALSAGALALPAAAGASAEPVQAPEKAQRRHFAIFNTMPETPPPILTLGFKQWLAKAGAAGHGFNPALAQRAQPPGPRRSIWVVPGRRSIMLAEVAPAGQRPYPKIVGFEQSSTRHAIRHGLGLGVVSGHSVGLVPDGVIGVRLSHDLVAPVGENVFAAPGALDSWFGRWRFIHGASATGG